MGFWRRFIWSVFLGYGDFGNALYRVFYQVMGVLATLYKQCFIRLWGFCRRFINNVLLVYRGFGDPLYRMFY